MIKDKLDIAVDQCIQAAGHEIEPSKQKQLLRVLVLQTIIDLFGFFNNVHDPLPPSPVL